MLTSLPHNPSPQTEAGTSNVEALEALQQHAATLEADKVTCLVALHAHAPTAVLMESLPLCVCQPNQGTLLAQLDEMLSALEGHETRLAQEVAARESAESSEANTKAYLLKYKDAADAKVELWWTWAYLLLLPCCCSLPLTHAVHA